MWKNRWDLEQVSYQHISSSYRRSFHDVSLQVLLDQTQELAPREPPELNQSPPFLSRGKLKPRTQILLRRCELRRRYWKITDRALKSHNWWGNPKWYFHHKCWQYFISFRTCILYNSAILMDNKLKIWLKLISFFYIFCWNWSKRSKDCFKYW